MGAAVPIIAAISGVLGAGASVAGAVQTEKARQAADNEAGRQAAKRSDAEKAAAAKLADEEATATANAQREAQAARVRGSRKTGRAGTILTGPLGASGGQTQAKTLLGS